MTEFMFLFSLIRITTPEIIIIVLVVLLLFGAKRIPDFMRSIGKGIRDFKDSMRPDNEKDEKSNEEK